MNDPATVRASLRKALAERFGEQLEIPEDAAGLDGLLRIASNTPHRAWSSKPVPDRLVKLLAACALSAPSKSYLQQADIIHVRDPAKRGEIQQIVPEMPWMADAPAFLVFCGDGRRFRRLFEQRGQLFTNDNLDGFFNAAVDGALVMMNFINAASAVGMVSCPISVIRNDAERVARILEMPERIFPIAGLCVGFPAQDLSINPRLSLDATFHIDRIGDLDADALVDEFDGRYIAARRTISARAGGSARPPQAWSDERAKQYARPQRALWGRFIRMMKFDLS